MGYIGPIPDDQMPRMTPKAIVSTSGEESFQAEAEGFYTWYQSIRQATFSHDGYRGLHCIMQIGEKGTATPEESRVAQEELKGLREDLEGGKKTLDQIPQEIAQIVNHLTEDNPKSRIVMHATRIEIAVNLAELESPKNFGKMMQTLFEQVNRDMPPLQARAISDVLQRGLDREKVDMQGLQKQVTLLLKGGLDRSL